ncbi:hypothetical protein E2C01_026148 [Portunus trituberculatus]|uniref:Uncharacterized protein n=1 Tax=Portunus trituberculatus TaxID=210409 RepID=A0A5B7EHC3_PORTR|nr:hypothetical protein [Portunus trituberculatus]
MCSPEVRFEARHAASQQPARHSPTHVSSLAASSAILGSKPILTRCKPEPTTLNDSLRTTHTRVAGKI